MINFSRILVLTEPYFNQIVKFYYYPLIWLGIGILLSTFPITINEGNVMFVGLPWGNYKEAFIGILHELFSWFWLFLALPYTLRKLLLPLGDSTTISQMLWLRMTPALPCEVAIARSLRVIIWAVLLGILGLLWVVSIILFHNILHQVSWSIFGELSLNVLALMSYVFLAGGIAIILDIFLAIDDYSGKRLITAYAGFIPIILAPVYIVIRNSKYALNFPYASPFFKAIAGNKESLHHFLIAIGVGISLLILHILIHLGTSNNNKIFQKEHVKE